MGNFFTNEETSKKCRDESEILRTWVNEELNKVEAPYKKSDVDMFKEFIHNEMNNIDYNMNKLNSKISQFGKEFSHNYNMREEEIIMCLNINDKKKLIDTLQHRVDNYYDKILLKMVTTTINNDVKHLTDLREKLTQKITDESQARKNKYEQHSKLIMSRIESKKADFDKCKFYCLDDDIRHCENLYITLKLRTAQKFSDQEIQHNKTLEKFKDNLLLLQPKINEIKKEGNKFQTKITSEHAKYKYKLKTLIDSENHLDAVCSDYVFNKKPNTRMLPDGTQINCTFASNNGDYDSSGEYDYRHSIYYMKEGIIKISEDELIVVKNRIDIKIFHNNFKINRIEFNDGQIRGIINYEFLEIIIKKRNCGTADNILLHITINNQTINEPIEYDVVSLNCNNTLQFPFKLPIKTASVRNVYNVLNDDIYAQYITEWEHENDMRNKVPIILECGHSKAIDQTLICEGKLYFCDHCDEKKRINQTIIKALN